MINALTMDDVICIPYANHIMYREFDDTAFFQITCVRVLCGCLFTLEVFVEVLLCSRHHISVTGVPSRRIDRWFRSNIVSSVIVIRENAIKLSFPRECIDFYLEWYFIVSLPRIIPHVQPANDVVSSRDGGHSDDVT